VKSRKKYDKAYQQFEDWCREKRIRDITEEVLLAYFEQKSRKLKGSTLWSLFSMLRSTIQLKKNIEINVHQKKINRSGFEKIQHFYQAGDRKVPKGSG
jgi:hypothetical protein